MQKLFDTLTPPATLRAQQAAEREPVWAVWHYDAETWQWYDTQEWRRTQVRTLIFAVAGFVWAGLWAVMPGFLFPVSMGPFAEIFTWLVPAWIVVATLVFAALPYRRARRMHLARQQGPAVISIGPAEVTEPGGAVAIGGTRARWAMVGLDVLSPPMHTLREVKVQPGDPAVVRFGGWGGRSWPTAVRVPIPRGGESEAARLVARFRQEILDQPG